MTIRHDHAFCDGPHRGDPAVTPVTSERFERWERIPMQDGPEAHLCERCVERQAKGWLAEPFVLECSTCGRNTVDNPELKDWRTRVAPDGTRTTLCADCAAV